MDEMAEFTSSTCHADEWDAEGNISSVSSRLKLLDQQPSRLTLQPARVSEEDLEQMFPSTSVASSEARSGVASLQTTCVSVLALHLDEYLDQLGAAGLSWLPPDIKAVLIAVARRRRSLHDALLLALVDTAFTSLDLWGCGNLISDKAIRLAASRMPNLQAPEAQTSQPSVRHTSALSDPPTYPDSHALVPLQALDITGCINITPNTLRRMAVCCPRLKLLRLGVPPVEQAALVAIPDILPRLTQVGAEQVEEDWESLADAGLQVELATHWATRSGDQATEGGLQSGHDGATQCTTSATSTPAAAAAAAFGHGRLSELKWLVWPGAPREIERLVASQCPKVQLNPMPRSLSQAVARAASSSTLAAGIVVWPPALGARGCASAERQAAAGVLVPAAATPSSASWRSSRQAGNLVPDGSPVPFLAEGGVGQLHAQGGGSSASPRRPTAATSGSGLASTSAPTPAAASWAWDPLDPMCALDEPLVARLCPTAWQGLQSGAASATTQAMGCKSVAERFRQAYRDQAQRLKDRERRAVEVLRQRKLRDSTALQALSRWLDEE